MKKRLVQYYYLSPTHVDSNRVLEVLSSQMHDRATLGLGYLKPGAANQLWMFVPCGDGFYEILNKNSLRVLDDAESCRYPGCPVHQFGRHGLANQHWRIKKADTDNRIQIIPKTNTSYSLDVGSQSTDRHAQMVLWHNWKGPNQIWRLIPA